METEFDSIRWADFFMDKTLNMIAAQAAAVITSITEDKEITEDEREQEMDNAFQMTGVQLRGMIEQYNDGINAFDGAYGRWDAYVTSHSLYDDREIKDGGDVFPPDPIRIEKGPSTVFAVRKICLN